MTIQVFFAKKYAYQYF